MGFIFFLGFVALLYLIYQYFKEEKPPDDGPGGRGWGGPPPPPFRDPPKGGGTWPDTIPQWVIDSVGPVFLPPRHKKDDKDEGKDDEGDDERQEPALPLIH